MLFFFFFLSRIIREGEILEILAGGVLALVCRLLPACDAVCPPTLKRERRDSEQQTQPVCFQLPVHCSSSARQQLTLPPTQHIQSQCTTADSSTSQQEQPGPDEEQSGVNLSLKLTAPSEAGSKLEKETGEWNGTYEGWRVN